MFPKILIVDDEADIVEMVGYNLREASYSVCSAATGAEALDRARQCRPDLIILDLMLPELDGISVCEMLKKIPATSSIPVLVLTSWSSEDAKVIALGVGAADYMLKPFSPRELVARVASLLPRNSVPSLN